MPRTGPARAYDHARGPPRNQQQRAPGWVPSRPTRPVEAAPTLSSPCRALVHATAIRVKACPSPGAPGPRGARSAASKWGSDPAHRPGSVDTRSVWLIIARRRAAPPSPGSLPWDYNGRVRLKYGKQIPKRPHPADTGIPPWRGNPSDLLGRMRAVRSSRLWASRRVRGRWIHTRTGYRGGGGGG